MRTIRRALLNTIQLGSARLIRGSGDQLSALHHGHLHGKDGATAQTRPDGDRCFQQFAKTLHNRKTEPKTCGAFTRMVFKLMKFFENRAQFSFRYSGARVPDFNAYAVAVPA